MLTARAPVLMLWQGVKIDGCGDQRNNTLYAELMNKTGKAYTIENCHCDHFSCLPCLPLRLLLVRTRPPADFAEIQ